MSLDASADKILQWKRNPVQFVEEVFKVTPDAWQRDALMAFPTNRRLAMLSSKGAGKSAMLSWLIWNFLVTRHDPLVVCTSISAANLATGLWSELARWMAKSPLLQNQFEYTKTNISLKASPETWFCSARTWPKSADSSQQANTLAGLHADNLLFVLDEVGGIPDSVMAAAEAGLANDHPGKDTEAKIVMAGNPTHLSGPLYRAATTERHMWWLKEITSDPDSPNRTTRVSVEWAREQIEKYGRDNPWVLVNVFGKFPPNSINSLLGVDEVVEAMRRSHPEESYNWSQKRIGIDCARYGDDLTVLFPRQGLMAFSPVIMRNANTSQIAARVSQAKATWGSEVEFVDGTGGFGAGVVDQLISAGHSPMEIHFSSKATDPQFYNKRAEMIFSVANWVKRGGALPDDPEMVRELTEPTYTFKDGKLIIESKDQLKARLGYSSDRLDALALTFAHPDQPASDSIQAVLRRSREQNEYGEWDPFHDSKS